jgi:hypothetical protein
VDGAVAWNVLREQHGEAVADAACELSTSKAAIERALKEVAPRGSLAAYKRKALEAIGNAGRASGEGHGNDQGTHTGDERCRNGCCVRWKATRWGTSSNSPGWGTPSRGRTSSSGSATQAITGRSRSTTSARRTGALRTVTGTFDIKSKMAKVPIGAYVKITYVNNKDVGVNRDGTPKQPMKVFRVQTDAEGDAAPPPAQTKQKATGSDDDVPF